MNTFLSLIFVILIRYLFFFAERVSPITPPPPAKESTYKNDKSEESKQFEDTLKRIASLLSCKYQMITITILSTFFVLVCFTFCVLYDRIKTCSFTLCYRRWANQTLAIPSGTSLRGRKQRLYSMGGHQWRVPNGGPRCSGS